MKFGREDFGQGLNGGSGDGGEERDHFKSMMTVDGNSDLDHFKSMMTVDLKSNLLKRGYHTGLFFLLPLTNPLLLQTSSTFPRTVGATLLPAMFGNYRRCSR